MKKGTKTSLSLAKITMKATNSPLGKKTSYKSIYDKSLLFPIPRKLKRDEINIPEKLPFSGGDIWNAYEISWLDQKGKPMVALGEFTFPCESVNLIESKSLKLYLNSFNNTKISSINEVSDIIKKDLSEAVQANVEVNLYSLSNEQFSQINQLEGINIDDLDVECSEYTVNNKLLKLEADSTFVEESLNSHLLKSNCLVTGQPDWASVLIKYSGKKINRENLLKYIISFRNHDEFHEQCVERIFTDILSICKPEKLFVYARYTRRGGLDINPFRTNYKEADLNTNIRLIRQ